MFLQKLLKRFSVFYILAFTVALFSFSMGFSLLSSQKESIKRYQGENNKSLEINCDKLYPLEVVEMLLGVKVNLQLNHLVIDKDIEEEKIYDIRTYIKTDGLNRLGDLRYGEYLKNDEYNSNKNIGVFSNGLTDEKNFTLKAKDGSEIIIEEIGKTFDGESYIDVTNEVFYKVVGSKDLMSSSTQIIVSGEEEEIDKATTILQKFIDDKGGESYIKIYSFNIKDVAREKNSLMIATALIIAIIIMNSITISYLWVQDNKKELTLRKVCGAGSLDLTKIFFGKLLLNAIVGVIIALGVQYMLVILCKGMLYGLDIRLTMYNIYVTLLLAVGVSVLSSIPAYKYIGQVQPIEMLRGE